MTMCKCLKYVYSLWFASEFIALEKYEKLNVNYLFDKLCFNIIIIVLKYSNFMQSMWGLELACGRWKIN